MSLQSARESRLRSWSRLSRSTPEGTPQSASRFRAFLREHWVILALTVTALVIRLYHLGSRLIIFDEYLLLNPYIIPLGLADYASELWKRTTYNPGWAFMVWPLTRLFGYSPFWVRLPSCLAGTAAVPAIYIAAKTAGLGRRAALLAAAVLGLSVYQVEYGQQVLPYSLMPLGTCLSIGLMTRLARHDGRADAARAVMTAFALLVVVGAMLFCHNSTLIMLPALVFYWCWATARPAEGPDRGRRFRMALGLLGGTAVALAMLAWFFAKLGESDRNYLRAFFPGTFRDAPIRFLVSDTLNWADSLYVKQFPGVGRFADAIYFAGSRTFDFFASQLRAEYLISNLHPLGESARKLPWVFTLPMLALVFRGLVRSFRGSGASEARRWIACFAATLGVCLVFSTLRLYPLGGIRQLLPLTPFVALAAAAGVESRRRITAWLAIAGAVIWAAASLMLLPDYYRTTDDRIPPPLFKRLADRHGVTDFVAGDNLASLGKLALVAQTDRRFNPVRSADPQLARLVDKKCPFFVCSLSRPFFESAAAGAETQELPFDLALLKHYTVRPLIVPERSNGWFIWYVYLLEPKPGPAPPMVLEAELHARGIYGRAPVMAAEQPATVLVEFNTPMRPEDLTPDSIHLVPESAPGQFDAGGALPLRIGCVAGMRTVTIEALAPLAIGKRYLLCLSRDIHDAEGRALDANGPEYRRILEIPRHLP